jgi:hypothetical protein
MRRARGMRAASPHRERWLWQLVSTAAPGKTRHGRIPTYCAAVWGAHHAVLVELEVRIEDGRVELHFAIKLVAHLLPVGGWLRHGNCYRAIMSRSQVIAMLCCRVERRDVTRPSYLPVRPT